MKRKGGKFDHRTRRPKVLLRHCKCRSTTWTTDTSSLWTWQRSRKLFRFRGPRLGIQVLGLSIDNSTRQPYFCLETDFMPAFQLIMHSLKDVSLMQFQATACLFYNIAK